MLAEHKRNVEQILSEHENMGTALVANRDANNDLISKVKECDERLLKIQVGSSLNKRKSPFATYRDEQSKTIRFGERDYFESYRNSPVSGFGSGGFVSPVNYDEYICEYSKNGKNARWVGINIFDHEDQCPDNPTNYMPFLMKMRRQ